MLNFNPTTHTYSLDGQTIPSVTQILKAAGEIEVSPYAYTETGTAVHGACESINKGDGEIDVIPQSAIPRLKAYIQFLKDTGFKPLHAEQRVYHPTLKYAGTYDVYGLFRGFEVLVDIKTGAAADWHKIQLVAYRYALKDGYGITPKKCFSLYLPLNGNYKFVEVKPMEILNYWGRFRSALGQYKEAA
jgi:hypothetical protein